MRVINIIATLLLLWLFQVNLGMAQTKELKVGDKVPNQLLEIVNANSVEPKPTIINFWATWCVPCIKELGLLDSVLRETEGINILSVSYEDEKTIESFFERNSDLKSDRLTIISSDTLFKKYFPHRILPHNIWINAKGIVAHVTGGQDIYRENIFSFIKGQPINARNKTDDTNFDPFKPFHLSDSTFIYRSILTKQIDGILSGVTVQTINHPVERQVIRAFCYNSTLNNMLWLAVNMGKSPKNFYNTMRIETSDSLRFFSPSRATLAFSESEYNSKDEWKTEHTHCYELRMPNPVIDTTFFSYMLNDLKRNFNIEVKVIEDSILCSIITADDKGITKPNQNDSTFIRLNADGLTAENVTVMSLFEYLNEKVKDKLNDLPTDPPFIDRTGGLRTSINITFDNGVPKYEQIKQLIEKNYGIKVRHQKDKYTITIIKDMG